MAKERKGYVFEAKGKWFCRLTFTDSNGLRRNIKRTAKTKTEARELLKKINREFDDEGEKVIEIWRMSFSNLADYYEAHYLKQAKFIDNHKVEGLRDTRRVKNFLIHFRAYFGKKKLSEITYGDIYSYRSMRLDIPTPAGRKRTIASMNRELAYLRRLLNIALQQGWINKNPINCGETLILTSCERRRERILTLEEEQRLLAACEERTVTYTRNGKEITAKDDITRRKHLKPFLIALLDTGARKGEMLKLVWRDVDLKQRMITIQALNTKTLKMRKVGITQRFYDELMQLWKDSDKSLDSLVFNITDNVRRSFSTACRIAGIKEGDIDGLTLHCLRHTAATRLVNGQLPIQMVSRILGHSLPQTTYRYLSANDETLFQAASIFEAIQQNNNSI